jgi:hypothetical protein
MRDTFVPYAPPSAVLAVIQFYRKRDVPPSVNVTNLQQIGVTESLAPRTMAALKFLNLLHDDGTTSDQFRAIRYANDDDYQQVLTGILEAAYKDVLDHIDLAKAGDRELNNAFIPFSPGAQRGRMITLFQALAKEAGWPLAVEPKASSPRAVPAKPSPKAKVKATDVPRTRPKGPDPIPPVSAVPELTSGSGLRLSVTDADLAALSEDDFDTVWSALGLLQKARRQAMNALQEMSDQTAKRKSTEASADKGGE